MKKFASLILVLSIVFSMPLTSFAVGISGEEGMAESSKVDGISPPIQEVVPLSLEKGFGNLGKGESIHLGDVSVTPGKTEIYIKSCTWAPSSADIEIGFYPSDGGAEYCVSFSGGEINDFTITSDKVPSGSYFAYLRNNGSGYIHGAIYYSIT